MAHTPKPHNPTHIFFVLAQDPTKLSRNNPAEAAQMTAHAELSNRITEAGASKIHEKARCPQAPNAKTELSRAAEIPWGDPINPVFMMLTKGIRDGLIELVVDPNTHEVLTVKEYPLIKKPAAKTAPVKK